MAQTLKISSKEVRDECIRLGTNPSKFNLFSRKAYNSTCFLRVPKFSKFCLLRPPLFCRGIGKLSRLTILPRIIGNQYLFAILPSFFLGKILSRLFCRGFSSAKYLSGYSAEDSANELSEYFSMTLFLGKIAYPRRAVYIAEELLIQLFLAF